MQKPLFFQRPLPYAFYNATLILVILNVVVFLLRFITPHLFETYMYIDQVQGLVSPDQNLFVLFPNWPMVGQRPWTLVTALFIHQDPMHIIFNMLALLMIGSVVERKMGSHEFLLFYFVCGILDNVLLTLLYPLLGMNSAVLGASGAIFAVMLAFGTFFPTSTVLLMFVIPVKAYIMVLGLIAFSIIAALTGIMGNVSHLGHLSGVLFGFLYLLVRLRTNPIKEFIHARRYSM
jgi:membrane associated rhomboid family serine protease